MIKNVNGRLAAVESALIPPSEPEVVFVFVQEDGSKVAPDEVRLETGATLVVKDQFWLLLYDGQVVASMRGVRFDDI